MLSNYHQKFLTFLYGVICDFLHSRQITFNYSIYNFLQAYKEIFACIPAKRIDTGLKIGIESHQNLCL